MGRTAACLDLIQMPAFEAFRDAQSCYSTTLLLYYSTLSHEEVHWTRHESRLDRDLGRENGMMPDMPGRSSLPSWALPSCVSILSSCSKTAKTMRPTSRTASRC